MKIRIMTYNILHGFHSNEHILDRARLNHAKKAVRIHNPDILVLCEACYGGYNHTGIYVDYQRIFGYEHGFFGFWGDHEWGSCLLSRYPIDARVIKLVDRTAITGMVRTGRKKLYVDVYHASPNISESVRAESVRPLMKAKKHPYIITGDFNAVSDHDKYDINAIIDAFYSLANHEPERKAEELLSPKLIPMLRRYGLRDAMPRMNRTYTIPTDYASINKKSGIRIDHLFVSKDIKVLSGIVPKDKHTNWASDHYPILFDISY
ncbi:MAG: endonuclease/exonuclease/phosphatase family protein [Candidatus Woesearchaeota archaeon]